MKILIGNNTLDWLAGSETWTLTLAAQLKRLGHDVMAYSPQLGFIAVQLEALGIKCVSEFKTGGNTLKFRLGLQEQEDDYNFDVIICNHNHITKSLHETFPDVPIIATVHGILHKDVNTGEILPEHPVTEFKIDQYVAVSEEVQGLLKDVYNIDSVVIRNFFDLEQFAWTPPQEPKIKNVLINTNYAQKGSEEVEIILDVARHYDANVKAIGANFASSWDLQGVIKDVDLVVGMGRSVLEGFAMGKIALVHGRWGMGGVLTPETYNTIKETNFSGRNSQAGVIVSKEEIIAMIDKALADPKQAEWQLQTVLENHDVKVAAQEFIKIAEGLKNGRS